VPAACPGKPSWLVVETRYDGGFDSARAGAGAATPSHPSNPETATAATFPRLSTGAG
jgi:hypothetical protein